MLFYSIKYIDLNLILDILILVKQNILIDSKIESWRFKIVNNKLKIINLKQFVLDFIKYSTIYIIVCANVIKTLDKKLTKFEI